jgi:hypothetical protein
VSQRPIDPEGSAARPGVDPSDSGDPGTGSPATGLPAVDEALAGLADLDQRPVSEHHAALAAAHEVLHSELESPSEQAEGRG